VGAGEYLTNILDGVMNSMVEKLGTPMEGLLEGLNRYDPSDSFLASLKRMVSLANLLGLLLWPCHASLPGFEFSLHFNSSDV